jgi:hypothetical protein
MDATPAYAQFTGGGNPTSGLQAASNRTLRNSQRGAKPDAAAPPVLPGTKPASEAAAPTASPADMSPTDGLFDAINRGDSAAARDAVNRGANLDGQNVLGLTPLELSVDLGRNDISFLLLSMRGDDSTGRREARTGGDQGDAGRQVGATSKAASRSRVVAASSRAADEPDETTSRFYSGGGGTPIPAAGFVGFGGGR